jgi:hypothetical protein
MSWLCLDLLVYRLDACAAGPARVARVVGEACVFSARPAKRYAARSQITSLYELHIVKLLAYKNVNCSLCVIN